jgi:hypothetical protein
MKLFDEGNEGKAKVAFLQPKARVENWGGIRG